MDAQTIVVGFVGGIGVVMVLCFLAVGVWVGILEEMNWRPGEPLYYLMDKIIDFTKRIVRRLKRRGNGDAA